MADFSFSVRLEPALRLRLEEAAREAGSMPADFAAHVIEAYLDLQEFKKADIKAALAEAGKGVFISSEAIDRWMASWGTDNELPPPEPDIFPSNKS